MGITLKRSVLAIAAGAMILGVGRTSPACDRAAAPIAVTAAAVVASPILAATPVFTASPIAASLPIVAAPTVVYAPAAVVAPQAIGYAPVVAQPLVAAKRANVAAAALGAERVTIDRRGLFRRERITVR